MKRREALLGCALLGPALSVGAQSRPCRIYMILFRGETDVEKGFRATLQQRRLPVELIVRDVAQQTARIPDLIAEARLLQADLIYTWGTPVTLAVLGHAADRDPRRHVTDIPVVFTMVSSPEASGIVDARSNGVRNFTGVVHVAPLAQQLSAIRAWLPMRRMAVIYNEAEINSQLNVKDLRRIATAEKFDLRALPVPLSDRGQPIAAALPALVQQIARGKPDVLYFGPDTFLTAQRKVYTAAAVDAGLPVFAATEAALRDGQALFGLVARYENVGQLAALKVEQLWRDRRPAHAIRIETLTRFSYLVNMPVARRLDLYPPLKVVNYAEILR